MTVLLQRALCSIVCVVGAQSYSSKLQTGRGAQARCLIARTRGGACIRVACLDGRGCARDHLTF